MKKMIVFFCVGMIISGCKPEGMILVKGGEFMMGAEVAEGKNTASPVHSVIIDYDFYIAQYETVYRDYLLFLDDIGSLPLSIPEDWMGRPVTNTSWFQAVAYCNYLSEQNGLPVAYDLTTGSLLNSDGLPTDDITEVKGFRLPTEAEWEYTARGGDAGSDTLYSGSDNPDEVSWNNLNSGGNPAGVGQKLPNELGVYDMSGNVAEWCHDWSSEYTPSVLTNPVGTTNGTRRVVRGGSWFGEPKYGKVYDRGAAGPAQSMYYFGFRVAMTAE